MLFQCKQMMKLCNMLLQNVTNRIKCVKALNTTIARFRQLGEGTFASVSFWKKYLRPVISPSSTNKMEAHSLLKLTTANDGQLHINMYVKLDTDLLGLKVPKVGFLITKDPNHILDNEHQTQLPRVVGWNSIQLAYNAFIKLKLY